MQRYGIIYRAKFEDGRSYIGQTTKTLEKRIRQHKSVSNKPKYHFHRALQRYGFDKFSWETLQECSSIEELNDAEVYWIKHFDSIKNGFNNRTGGFISKMTEEAKEKLSEDRKGKGNPMYGKSSSVRGKGNLYAKNIPTKFKKGNIPWNKGKKGIINMKLSYDKAQEIRSLYKSGELIKNICEQFDITSNTIFDIVANRIWLFDESKKIQDRNIQILDMRNKGASAKHIANELDICLATVYKALKKDK